MEEPPTSCRQVMLARRKECGPSPGKSQPSAAAAFLRAIRTAESHSDFVRSSGGRETQSSVLSLGG